MGVWKKSPRQDPAAIARLQAAIRGNPDIQRQITAMRTAGHARAVATGRPRTNETQQIKEIYQRAGIQIPDGYDVDSEGQIVYTNKTPYLQQAAWGALPIAAVSALSALPGGAPAAALPPGGGAGELLPLITPGYNLAPVIPGVSAATAAGRSGWQKVANVLTNKGGDRGWMEQVIRALTGGVPAVIASRQNRPSAEEQATQAQLLDMLKGQQRRTTSQDPLFDAVTQLAMSRLPTSVQR